MIDDCFHRSSRIDVESESRWASWLESQTRNLRLLGTGTKRAMSATPKAFVY